MIDEDLEDAVENDPYLHDLWVESDYKTIKQFVKQNSDEIEQQLYYIRQYRQRRNYIARLGR